jgi:glycosyltransferase involved in cell wall biosynthesis
MSIGYLSAAARVSTRFDAVSSGARAHVLGFMGGLDALGYDVHPFILGDHFPSTAKSNSAESMRLNPFRALLADLGRLSIRLIAQRYAYFKLRSKVGIVYERFASFQAVGQIFQRHGRCWILETNGPFYEEAKRERKSMLLSSLARRLEFQAYRDCDLLVCVTPTLRNIMIREAKIPPEKIIVVPNGVDTQFFDPSRYKPRRLTNLFTVGFVGRLNTWQGVELLIDAIAELRDEKGAEIALTVVGDGVMRGSWSALAERRGIAAHFAGQVPFNEVPRYISGFDVGFSGQVLLKSGFMYHSPLKIYEYLAMGKPVIASAFDDARLTLREGDTGFLFAPGNKSDLKRALFAAFQKRHQLTEIGYRARLCAERSHSWQARVAQVMRVATEARARAV